MERLHVPGHVWSETRSTARHYAPPIDDDLGEDDVCVALDFLVAIQPDPEPETREEYEAVMARYRREIVWAGTTLRRFAEQTQPMTLEQMQTNYYGFTNDPRYLTSSLVSAIVTSSLQAAWDGVGRWRS